MATIDLLVSTVTSGNLRSAADERLPRETSASKCMLAPGEFRERGPAPVPSGRGPAATGACAGLEGHFGAGDQAVERECGEIRGCRQEGRRREHRRIVNRLDPAGRGYRVEPG